MKMKESQFLLIKEPVSYTHLGAVYIWHKPGCGAVYERCGHPAFYRSDKGKGSGLSGIQLCISGAGRRGHQ